MVMMFVGVRGVVLVLDGIPVLFIIPIVENLRAGVFRSRPNPYMVKAVRKASKFGTLKKTDDSRGSWLWDP